MGNVVSILDGLACISSRPGVLPYDLDTVLWLESRTPFGKIFDVFGQVVCPFYVVRVNEEDCKEKGISVGTNVYVAPKEEELTSFVHTTELKKIKGSDASWKNDEEPPENCLDYSDDEEERCSKKKVSKSRKRKNNNKDKLTNSSVVLSSGKADNKCNLDIYGNPIVEGPECDSYVRLDRPIVQTEEKISDVSERASIRISALDAETEDVEDIADAEVALKELTDEVAASDTKKMNDENEIEGNKETMECDNFFDEPPALH